MTRWRRCPGCRLLRTMRDGEVLCIGCIHRMITGGDDRLAEPAWRTRDDIRREEIDQ